MYKVIVSCFSIQKKYKFDQFNLTNYLAQHHEVSSLFINDTKISFNNIIVQQILSQL